MKHVDALHIHDAEPIGTLLLPGGRRIEAWHDINADRKPSPVDGRLIEVVPVH